MTVPADCHVHSEWSWDAAAGSMERTCAGAVELGLPAVAFADHLDVVEWLVEGASPEELGVLGKHLGPDSTLRPPPMDVDGYWESVERCRARFPDLRIMAGAEIGEPHRCREDAHRLLRTGTFDRVLGSLHLLPVEGGYLDPYGLFARWPADRVVREYLAELLRMLGDSDLFGILAHIDYPVRSWPVDARPFEPRRFEDEFRQVLCAAAGRGLVLEYNTSHPSPWIVPWWREEGGRAVSFGSDAHEPTRLAQGFDEARTVVEASGFGPGRRPHDFWTR